MERLNQILDRKNLILKNILKLTLEFKNNFDFNKLENLQTFQSRRNSLLKLLDQLDQILNPLLEDAKIHSSMQLELQQKIKSYITEKDQLARAILALDEEILAYIESAKKDTLAKLQDIQGRKKQLQGYKSSIFETNQAEGHTKLNSKA